MASTFGGYVTEWHGGKTRPWVNAYVSSQTDKTATIYVEGVAQASQIAQYGVRVRVYIDGRQVDTDTAILNSAGGTADYGKVSGTLTINKGSSGKNISCSCSIAGETVSGYGPISGSSTASVNVWVSAWTLRPPSAPSNLVAQRTAAGVIGLTWKNNATNASTTQIDRCPYGGAWSRIVDAPNVITSYADSVGTGTYKYRTYYWNADGFSGYSNESEWVTALCAPAAPTCVLPASGATLDVGAGDPTLTWRHNPLDTSDQTAAQIKWTFDGWRTVNSQSVEGTTSSIAIKAEPNTDVEWQVRTKGAYTGDGNAEAAWSPWSGVSLFRVRTAPSVVVHVDSVINRVPVSVAWDYDDAMGTQSSAEVSVTDAAGTKVYTGQVSGAASSLTIPPSDFTPIHLGAYQVSVTVTSTTSLQATDRADMRVEYEPPALPSCALKIDTEYARVAVTVYDGGGAIPAEHIAVFRDETLVADNLYAGQKVTDALPPVDAVVKYRVVAYAASGAVSEITREAEVPSLGRVYFDFSGDQCRMRYNMDYSDRTEGERVTRQVAGSKRPKVYFGEHETRTGSLSALATCFVESGQGEAEIKALERLKAYNGYVYMRRPKDEPLWVVCKIGVSKSYTKPRLASVTVDWEAVEL